MPNGANVAHYYCPLLAAYYCPLLVPSLWPLAGRKRRPSLLAGRPFCAQFQSVRLQFQPQT